MRKTLLAFSLMIVVCLPAVAGEVQMPPIPPTPPAPPCAENCTNATTATVTDTILLTVIRAVLGAIRG